MAEYSLTAYEKKKCYIISEEESAYNLLCRLYSYLGATRWSQFSNSMLTIEEVDRNALDSRGAGRYDLETMEAMIDQCYKGQDQEGADVYY